MEISIKAPANKSGQNDPFLITDKDMSVCNPKLAFFPNDFDRKFRRSIFHKYFLKSIEKVKEDKSRQVLLYKLHQQLDTGIYHFPISDIDPLYECIFETLPRLEPFRNNSELMDELFLIMNTFMFRFYDAAYPFFYDFTAEGNIFTYGPIFVINYFRQFSIRFYNRSITSDKPYLELLEQDGSLTNILNYFFDQYAKGVELPLLSDCIYNLLKWLNCNFLRDYLAQKNFFKTGPSIFVNSNIKEIIRMDFPIAFYLNYFENHYEKVSTPFLKLGCQRMSLYEEDFEKKEEIAREIIDDINDLKVKNYLETYLSSYVDQLIKEGRLLNTVNPLGSKDILNGSMSFYPPKAEDKFIFKLFDLLLFMFRFIGTDKLSNEINTKYQKCILDFIPIISTIYKVIPGIYLSDWIRWTLFLFDMSKESDSNMFESLKNTFLEIIQMRISGDFLYNLNSQEMFNLLTADFGRFSEPKEIISELNQTSISTYAQIIFLTSDNREYPIVDEDLFFSTIKFASLDSTIEWFNTVIKKMNDDIKRNVSRATITYLGNVSTEPKFIECVLDLFRRAGFYHYDYQNLNEKGIIPYFFKLFIETPDLQKLISPTKFYEFCNSIGKYIIYNDLLIEEALNTIIETNDMFRIKLFSIVLNYGSEEKYQSFVKRIVDYVISKTMEITPETINEQIIKQIISISPFLTTIKFNGNEKMFSILKASLDYLNKFDNDPNDLINIEEYHHDENQLKFDLLEQSKANIVYALTNSFGFEAIDEFLGLINYFLTEEYGMCIEVLNVISNIIGFLVEFIEYEDITTKISSTNETIFKITNILIANTPKKLINSKDKNENSENEESYDEEEREKMYFKRNKLFSKRKKMYPNQRRKSKDQKTILKFALYPLNYDTETSSQNQGISGDDDYDVQEENGLEEKSTTYSCFYSFKMKGQKADDTFGYTLNGRQHYKNDFKQQSVFIVNLFIRNITNYVINMLKIFGIKQETISLFKQIIMISIKNGLIQVPTLETFSNFVTDNHDFFANDEEVNIWISALAERSRNLMKPLKKSKKDELEKLEIGNEKEQLRLIFLLMYNMNKNILPGCLIDDLIDAMFENSTFSQESFLNFINSDGTDVDIRLNEFFEQ